MRLIAVAIVVFACVLAGSAGTAAAPAAAWIVTSLDGTSAREERPDILDTPVLPGSVAKIVALIAAVETGVVNARTTHMCRRIQRVNGVRYVCSHPDLKRPLTAAEALAHSCNDFFLSLVPRLSIAAVNDVRRRIGLPSTPAGTDFPGSLVGLAGARTTPRRLLDAFLRVVDPSRRGGLQITPAARAILTEGLSGAARYGSASALGEQRVAALAKTGTAPMPGGGSFGIVLAATPVEKPTRAAVVIAPGAAGRDAAAIAAELLGSGPAKAAPYDAGPAKAGHYVLRIGHPGGARQSLRELSLEDYVAGVVAGEGQPDAAAAAHRALAVAARTFAVVHRGRHRSEGFDLCDTTHCQVMRPATASSRNAAMATAGKVLTRDGRPVAVYYSAWCGGHSQPASNIWPGSASSTEQSRQDDACAHEPEWVSELSAVEIERALRAAGRTGDRLRDFTILRRDGSGRVASFRADGFRPAEISGEDFRIAAGRAVGWERMKSTLLEMSRTPRGYRFRGRGMGHGVGLCVRGAGTRALRGATAEQILRVYYPELRVALMAPAPEESAPGHVLLALPAHEEDARTEILSLVTRTRDEVGRKAGVVTPRELRVTVHPDVGSFSRATGLPWWVAGATRGTTIHLLPVRTLKARGQLTRTIRHEVVHAVLDNILSGKPMWVREGAALTFAEPATTAAPATSLMCPADSEFLKPSSVVTLRQAYARAEQCFRRELKAGKRWSEVSVAANSGPASW